MFLADNQRCNIMPVLSLGLTENSLFWSHLETAEKKNPLYNDYIVNIWVVGTHRICMSIASRKAGVHIDLYVIVVCVRNRVPCYLSGISRCERRLGSLLQA